MSNTTTFYEKGKEFIVKAIYEDNKKNYANALTLYKTGIEMLTNGLNVETNKQIKTRLKLKIKEYSKRMQRIEQTLTNNDNKEHDSNNSDNTQSVTHLVMLGTEKIKAAVQHDNLRHYHSAICLYAEGMYYLQKSVLNEPNPNVVSAILDKLQKYKNRAAEIKNCYEYLQDIPIQDLNRTLLQDTKTGSYSWKIPVLSPTEIMLLLHGYFRENSLKYIPIDIINVSEIYYDLRLLHSIKNAQNEEQFYGNIFNIGTFKFRIKIYPNGQKQSRKENFMYFIKLISLSPA
eukprot:187668_1